MKSFYCLLTVNLLFLDLGEIISTSSPFIPVTKNGSFVQRKLQQFDQFIHEFENLTSKWKCYGDYQDSGSFVRRKFQNIDQLVHELEDFTSKLKCYDGDHDFKPDFRNNKPKDCYDLKKNGNNQSGIYEIWPRVIKGSIMNDISFQVYCDMDIDGGGWTVFQRRGNFGNPSNYFYRDWKSYAEGFGELDREFWLGNDKLYVLTNQDNYTLRVDLKDDNGDRAYAHYWKFKIGNENEKYKLYVNGYTGNAGDSLSAHNGKRFYTKDDDSGYSCAKKHKGAWWYKGGWLFKDCHHSNLNGLNLNGERTNTGINWYHWKKYDYSISNTEMKIRLENV